MKKSINILFIFILTSLSYLLTFSIFLPELNHMQIKNSSSDVVTKSVTYDSLSEDVESLTFSANLKEKTLTYDVTFKTSEFDDSEVRSLYYYHSHGVDEYGGIIYLNQYERIPFDNSSSVVKDRHATNTASYEQIFQVDMGSTWTSSINGGARINLEYEKDGEFVVASLIPQELYLFDGLAPFRVDDTKTIMTINEEKTYAELNFTFSTNERTYLESIYLKSHSNNLNQKIYSSLDDEYSLWQGDGVISFELLSRFEYQDLYIEYTFSDLDVGQYTWQSDITNDLNFTSGVIKTTWNTSSIILLLIVLILMTIVLLFIILVFKQIKKRKKLEKQQNQVYYDQNYQD